MAEKPAPAEEKKAVVVSRRGWHWIRRGGSERAVGMVVW